MTFMPKDDRGYHRAALREFRTTPGSSRLLQFEKEDIVHRVKGLSGPLELYCDREMTGKAELTLASFPTLCRATCPTCIKAMPAVTTLGPGL